MRGLLYIVTGFAVMALAFWAYRENYRTQAALTEVQELQREIGTARERLAILRAEWAYLNRPERLRDLADINFATLGLLPLMPDQFGQVDQVGYPPSETLLVTDPVEVTGITSLRAGEDTE